MYLCPRHINNCNLHPWTKYVDLALSGLVDHLPPLFQFPYRFQHMDSVSWTCTCSGVEHHFVLHSHSTQWASGDCLPHQSSHSVVQDTVWNLLSHHPGNRPHWHLYLLHFTPTAQDSMSFVKRLLEFHHFLSIPTALIFTQPLRPLLFPNIPMHLLVCLYGSNQWNSKIWTPCCVMRTAQCFQWATSQCSV